MTGPTNAATELIIIEPSIFAFKSPTTSSRVKTTAAIGVLNAAEIPPAVPTATKAFTRFR